MTRAFCTYQLTEDIKTKMLQWAANQKPCVVLDSHALQNQEYPNGFTYDMVIGVGSVKELVSCENSFQKLKDLHNEAQDWMLGFLSYDLKNELEDVSSNNQDLHEVPHLHFFIPETVIALKGDMATFETIGRAPKSVYEEILSTQLTDFAKVGALNLKPRIHHAEYIRGVKSLQHHIQMGDIYEANFCQEFYVEEVDVNPFDLYQSLMRTSPTPFSAFCNFSNHYLMCASPERFIKKTGNKIVSQPIKGTAKRSPDKVEDARLKEGLFHSKKDRIENVMIVDLVRNDLSRTAQKSTVKVDELFGVYSFSNVHQMISTISCEMDEKYHFTDVIKNAFPMGSMTGAPKIMATKLIEQFEHTKRGIYSGSVGYITPSGDFDFNVVIRSLQYQAEKKYLSYMVGGAITHNSDPEDEYHECEVKAASIKKVLAGE